MRPSAPAGSQQRSAWKPSRATRERASGTPAHASTGARRPNPGAISERELQGDLIAAENTKLSRLFEAGTISAATRRRQRRLDLSVAGARDLDRVPPVSGF